MGLFILRFVFSVVAIGAAVSFIVYSEMPAAGNYWFPWILLICVVLVAAAVIAIDLFVPKKRIDIISTVYFGTLVGFFMTYVVSVALTPLIAGGAIFSDYREAIQIGLGIILCYTCISLLMQTKDDFRFIIPYVEFSKEMKGLKPFVLDTSVIIDGRIADVMETQFTDNQLVIPRFVLAELQAIADSSDKLRRSRGRRGLDILNRLRNNKEIDLRIHEHEIREMADQPVDMKLVILARNLNGKIVTGDYNLNKVARLNNVGVINLNDLANALKPVFLPGERVEVRIVKPGEESGQGIGYLDDGTMIVVEGGRDHINENIQIFVTSVLQTSAGRMVFGRFDTPAEVSQHV